MAELLAEYDRLETDWQELTALWSAVKSLLRQPLSQDILDNFDPFKHDVARLHVKQAEILNRMDEIENRVFQARASRQSRSL